MADIFEEVEESLRQDKLTVAWRKYGVFAYIAAALLIGGVALNEYLKTTRQEAIVNNAQTLEIALTELEANNYEQSAQVLEALSAEEVRLSPIAAHLLAQVRLEGNGDEIAAADLLADVGAQADSPSSKLALLKAAYLRADTLSREELDVLLMPLREDDSAFSALALELSAAKALQEGDIEFARSEFTFLQIAPNVPSGTAQRAARALAALPPAEIEDPSSIDVGLVETVPGEEAPAASVEETGE